MASTFVLDPSVNTTGSVPRLILPNRERKYKDKQYEGGESEWKKRLESSTTIYVGNLSFYTNEYQLHELFGRCGSVKRVIMGLDKIKKTPCGFCFVEFEEREAALKSIKYLHRTHLDGRAIQVDIDAGFKEGRQFGRAAGGGQLGDERRQQYEQRANYNQRYGGPSGNGGAANIMTRSITIVACLSILSMLMITSMSHGVGAVDKQPKLITPFGLTSNRLSQNPHYYNSLSIRKAQMSEARTEFERSFALFLVNIMKAAKPTLLRAFISATLADKQLKDIAIAMFFNNTESTDN